jgi:hypothetical protein
MGFDRLSLSGVWGRDIKTDGFAKTMMAFLFWGLR